MHCPTRGSHIFLLLMLLGLASCSAMDTHRRISSRAYDVIERDGAEEAYKRAQGSLEMLESRISDSLSQLDDAVEVGALDSVKSVLRSASGEEPVCDSPSQLLAQCENVDHELKVLGMFDTYAKEVGGAEGHAIREAVESASDALAEKPSYVKTLELSKKTAEEVRSAVASGSKYLVSAEPYFSVGAVVAFDNDLEATSIPVVSYNMYPFDFSDKWDTIGFQFVFGGALSSGGGGESDIGLALGGGFFTPVGESGSLSIGHIVWDEDGNGENGWYVGINIGSSSKSTSTSG